MRLAVASTSEGQRVVVDRGNGEVHITDVPDLPTALAREQASLLQAGRDANIDEVSIGPAVGRPGKVICVGHNFKQHILEMGHDLPQYPNVFSKFPDALIGDGEGIVLDPAATSWDWEAELVCVVGRIVRRVSEADAKASIAGYTVANDISARDWQRRSTQWLLGKTFENTTPIGPWIVTADEVDPADGLRLSCTVDGVEEQRSTTDDLLFGPALLVSYLSTVMTLRPGDVILTGTPGGVGAAQNPPVFLEPGQTVATEIEGIGRLTNVCTNALVTD